MKKAVLRSLSAILTIALVLTVLPKTNAYAIVPDQSDLVTVIQANEATVIEAENWMEGGQDAAFHEKSYEEADVYKHPRAPRPEDPNDSSKYVPQTKDFGSGGYCVTYATDPEWIRYQVTVEQEGDYVVAFCCARGYDGGGLTLTVEGGDSITVPYGARTSADWSFGMTAGEYVLHLPAGSQVLKLDINWPWDIDYIQLTPVEPEDSPVEPVSTISAEGTSKVEAEDWMDGGQNVAYYEKSYEEADVYKAPRGQRPEDPNDSSKFVPQTKDFGSGGFSLTYATDPEWIRYKVTVEQEGDYLVAFCCARGYDGGGLTLTVEGGDSITIPYTARTAADWSFGMTEGEYVLHLPAGDQVLKLDINWPWDIDYIELTPVSGEPLVDPPAEPVTTIYAEGTSKIEAEDWMDGGQNVAYYEKSYEDADVYKAPRGQRPEDPNDSSKYVPQTKDSGSGGYHLTYATDPEWIKYKVNVEAEGNYAVAFYCARGYEGGGLKLSDENGASVTVPYTARTAADWSFGMTEGNYILHLTAGEQILKLEINWPWDIDYIELIPVQEEAPTEPITVIKAEGISKIEAEDWMNGGQNVAYFEKSYETVDVYKHPRGQRPEDPNDSSKYVPQTKDYGSGGYHVTYATDPEWIKYKVNVEEEGNYIITFCCARGFEGGSLTLSVEGGGRVSIPYTARNAADWSFGMTTGKYILHLPAGEQILRLDINWPWDIDYIQLTPTDEAATVDAGDITPVIAASLITSTALFVLVLHQLKKRTRKERSFENR